MQRETSLHIEAYQITLLDAGNIVGPPPPVRSCDKIHSVNALPLPCSTRNPVTPAPASCKPPLDRQIPPRPHCH